MESAGISFSNLQNADSNSIIHAAVAEHNKTEGCTSCRIYDRLKGLAEHEFISRIVLKT